MAGEVYEFQVDQNGDAGGEGMSRFHWVTGTGDPATDIQLDAIASALHDFYAACSTEFPGNMTYAIQSEVRVLDAPSGRLTAVLPVTNTPPDVHGAGALQGYGGGLGARINWKTSVIVNHRVLRGATFLVPLTNGAYTGSGGLGGPSQTTIKQAADGLLAAGSVFGCALVVYHRPKKGTFTGGTLGPVVANTVPGVPASLRSRRS